jgi:hypothetical protein
MIFMGVFYFNAMAMAPITNDLIKEAQEYGKNKSGMEYTEFLKPWTSFEEKAFKLDETTDRAYLYSPFLCLAADSREKVLKGQAVDITDSQKVLEDYGGFLIFSVSIFGDNEQFSHNITAALKQNKKSIPVYQASIPAEPTKISVNNHEVYMVQAYFYFQETDVAISQPVLLAVQGNKKQRNFYFDLAKIK